MNSKFTQIVRIFLGLLLLLSGLNKILEFIPTPAGNLIESFGQVDYIFPIVAVLEIIIAVLLLSKKWVAFALILLVPPFLKHSSFSFLPEHTRNRSCNCCSNIKWYSDLQTQTTICSSF